MNKLLNIFIVVFVIKGHINEKLKKKVEDLCQKKIDL